LKKGEGHLTRGAAPLHPAAPIYFRASDFNPKTRVFIPEYIYLNYPQPDGIIFLDKFE
jgi:hypothetical protein